MTQIRKVIDAIPDWILPFYVVSVLGVVLFFILAVQFFINDVIQTHTTVWEGVCEVGDVNTEGDIGFAIDCKDQGKGVVQDTEVVRSYLNNPGALVCRKSLNEYFHCKPRELPESAD